MKENTGKAGKQKEKKNAPREPLLPFDTFLIVNSFMNVYIYLYI